MSANLPVPLLEAKAVAKHFGGVKALRDVSLTIRRGEIYGLIGPNGAGKTTFFNCMTGLYVPDGGGFVFAGAPLVADAGGVFAFLPSSMSQLGSVPNSHGWLYRTSKAALNMAVAAAQHDYPRATLLTIAPGWVQTEMGGADAPLTAEQSVRGMLTTLASVTEADRGQLLHHDGSRSTHR